MESRIEIIYPLDPKELHQKFEKFLKWVDKETQSHTETTLPPLMQAVQELYYCKSIKYDLDCCIHSQAQQQSIRELNDLIYQLRHYIQEEVNNSSDTELLKMTIDLGRERRNTLIEFLAEIGEAHLFNSAHKKIANCLSAKEYFSIYCTLRQAYMGTEYSQSLGLGFIDISRGNQVYVQMMREMCDELKNSNQDFLKYLTKQSQKGTLDPSSVSKKVFLNRNTFIKGVVTFYVDRFFNEQDIIYDKSRKTAQLKELYKEYVESPNEIHLMDERVSNYLSKGLNRNRHGFLSQDSLSFKPSEPKPLKGFTISCPTM